MLACLGCLLAALPSNPRHMPISASMITGCLMLTMRLLLAVFAQQVTVISSIRRLDGAQRLIHGVLLTVTVDGWLVGTDRSQTAT